MGAAETRLAGAALPYGGLRRAGRVERPGVRSLSADVLAECARILRPGAVMLATVPDLGHPVRWLEGAARALALVPGAEAVSGRWPRIEGYRTYLRISRQRHGVGWWSQAAARAGLLTVPAPADPGQPDPLRLLTFQRPCLPRGCR